MRSRQTTQSDADHGFMGMGRHAAMLDPVQSPINGGSLRTRKVIAAGDLDMHYTAEGPHSGSPVVFLHDLGASLHQFIPQLALAQQGYRVVIPSLRGHGESISAISPEGDQFTIRQLSQDTNQLLDRLELRDVNLVGCGLGAVLGWELLSRHPSRLATLTMIGLPAPARVSLWQRLCARYQPQMRSWPVLNQLTRTNPRAKRPMIMQRLERMASQASPTAQIRLGRQLLDHILPPPSKSGHIPILWLLPDGDPHQTEFVESVLTSSAQRLTLHTIRLSGVSRYANMELPRRFNQLLHSFVSNPVQLP